MLLRLYQVDAFAAGPFTGNPAAVCPLEARLPDELMQGIALENNLSETAFFVPEGEGFALRWFTPVHEVDLCGHATLASAWVVANHVRPGATRVAFSSKSGPLEVLREGERYTLDFPTLPLERLESAPGVAEALGAEPVEVRDGMDMLVVFEREADVRALVPDLARVAALDTRGVIATAPGDEVDFVSRFFAPRSGVPEDPVTGSAHCLLTPYWAERLGRTSLRARQLSKRGGELEVELRGERTHVSGRVQPYLEGVVDLGRLGVAP